MRRIRNWLIASGAALSLVLAGSLVGGARSASASPFFVGVTHCDAARLPGAGGGTACTLTITQQRGPLTLTIVIYFTDNDKSGTLTPGDNIIRVYVTRNGEFH